MRFHTEALARLLEQRQQVTPVVVIPEEVPAFGAAGGDVISASGTSTLNGLAVAPLSTFTGTNVSSRDVTPNSSYSGFFSVPSAQERFSTSAAIILCKSAIDALSCFLLYPDHRCISTAGVRPDPPWLPHLIATGTPVFCGFDADPTGDAMARQMIARHPSVQHLRPSRKDWNDTLRFMG